MANNTAKRKDESGQQFRKLARNNLVACPTGPGLTDSRALITETFERPTSLNLSLFITHGGRLVTLALADRQ